MLKTDEIRQKYLDFFKRKAHAVVPSDSLVPQNDPTLLFTGAGMNQFKDNFLGIKKDLKRATSSQKCLRTGDLEEVGRTAFHHSFFEMLGNFSFGDYFKKEAIEWAWEFLTKELQIPESRLRVSVHKTDDEAFAIWEKIVGPKKIDRLGDKDNFWPSNAPKDGPNGPCGPCSEIYFDQNPSGAPDRTVEHKDFAEIWNLVFTQFDRQDGGKLVPLAQKNIDTGMGLERLTCVLQGQKTNFEIDLFQPINEAIEKELSVKVPEAKRRGLYAISDHLRAVVFCMTDGVIPSNEGRGYVIRKLIRRALWHAHELSPSKRVEQPFLYKAMSAVVSVMKSQYPELADAQPSVSSTLKGEEERFLTTLDTGLRILEQRLQELEKKKSKQIPGEAVFELYDTYGFPDELTRKIADEKGFTIDQTGFEKQMEEQRKRAKDATKISGAIFTVTDLDKNLSGLPGTKFTGYDGRLQDEGKVLFAGIKDGKGVVVLEQTPMYAESGGQVGDHGHLKNSAFEARVTDTQKKDIYFLHLVDGVKGSLKTGDKVTVMVDRNRRERAMRNHTATHLLHAALRDLLGNQVRQLGSLVAPEKLRFDYSYAQPLTAEQIKALEDRVNAEILKNNPLTKEEKSAEDAKKEGALAFFGEKYGDKVRVVTVPGFSKEFCGGTHCDATGQIGLFVITSDSSIASGTRRIEALTGEGAIEYVRGLRGQMNQIAQTLKSGIADIPERIAKLQDNVKKLEKEKSQAPSAKTDPDKLIAGAVKTGPVSFIAYKEKGLEGQQLRVISDVIRSKSPKTIYLLCSENEDKIQFLLGATPDLAKDGLDMREIGKSAAALLQCSCGGRPDLVQGGGPNQGQLQTQWDKVSSEIQSALKAKVS